MRISSVIGLYFSPTGTTRTLVIAAAEQAAQTLGVPCRLISLNTPAERETEFHFSADTLVIVGAPTYAGRLPNKISPDLRRILHGSGSPAVALVTYGNRAYENALAELFRVLTDGGMKPAAGAVCVCQHSIARALAVGRPNEEDCAEVRRFAAEAAERIQADEIVLSPAVPGDADSSYYVPTGTSGKPAKFLKSAPQTDPEKKKENVERYHAMVKMMVAIERQNLLQIAEDKNFLNSDADLDSFIDGLETALIISMLVEDDTNEFMRPGETPQGIRKFTLGGE